MIYLIPIGWEDKKKSSEISSEDNEPYYSNP